MALLAEQKRKVKYGLDPRNTNWSNDESKLGQKLMEKMGWSKGKGLGANEDGITDHIKASYKSDSRGLGCTLKDADAWVAHQDDFNDLLKTLNSENPTAPVEEDKKSSSKRFYGRFARGGVKTLRSTEDLDCIFGNRKEKKKSEDKAEVVEVKDESADNSDGKEHSHGLETTTSSYSVQEYFAKKMAEKRLLGAKFDSFGSVSAQDRKEVDRPSFGAVGFSYDKEPLNETEKSEKVNDGRGWYDGFLKENLDETQEIPKQKKKRKHKDKDDGEESQKEEIHSDVEISKKKKKKNQKKNDKEITEVSSDKDTESDVDTSEKKKKRKSKEKNNKDITEVLPEEKNSDVEISKKKKKRKQKVKDNQEVTEMSPEKDITSDIDASKETKKKKHKEKDYLQVTEVKPEIVINSDEDISKKRKRKEKENTENLPEEKKIKICDVENLIDDPLVQNKQKKKKREQDIKEEVQMTSEKPSEKKKKKNKCDNIQEALDESSEIVKDVIENDRVSKKGKKKCKDVECEEKKTDKVKRKRKKKRKTNSTKDKVETESDTKKKIEKENGEKVQKDVWAKICELNFKGSNISDIPGYVGMDQPTIVNPMVDHTRKWRRRNNF